MTSASSTPVSTPRSAASSTQAPDAGAARAAHFQLVPVVALAIVSAAAWAWIARLANEMSAMSAMTMIVAQPWSTRDAAVAFVMWSVMMVAMMTPSASPMVLTFHRLGRSARATAAFLGGYLLVWATFSVLATALQASLQAISVMDADAMRVTPALGGALFIVAGIWQLTPLRDVCLSKCRSPVSFLMSEWRDGVRGALTMGTRHGAWCVGCCWALMLLLFATGVMNLAWVAVIAAWVLLEKTLPDARWLGRAGAIAALAFGGWILVNS